MRFAFISSCTDLWGGSEELWSNVALRFADNGHIIRAFKTNIDYRHPRITKLENAKCLVKDLNHLPPKPIQLAYRFLPHFRQNFHKKYTQRLLNKDLKYWQPHLAVISQGINFDGVYLAEVCQMLNLPYALIAQKAIDFLFPSDADRAVARAAYESAAKCYFVSRHNLNLTEEQIGVRLSNAEIVFNPFAADFDNPISWNNDEKTRLACVGRLFLIDKGQDILLRVLAAEKWKKRNLEITFFGEGTNRQAIVEMAELLGVDNIKLGGYVQNVDAIWERSHALVLPSRSEGLPLVLIEAMLYGRPSIVTNVGGMAEVVEDNVTGFIAASATAEAFDEALERAWSQRRNWQLIGKRAAESVKKIIPADPGAEFAEKLLELVRKLH